MSQQQALFSCQRVVWLAVFFSYIFQHILRMNISIAIVEMVATPNTTQQNYGPRYVWNEVEKNNILGLFFWGYTLTQFPGGRLSEKFGPKIVLGVGLLTACVCTILTPIAAHFGYWWLLVTRLCVGLGLGVHFPLIGAITTRWIPPSNTTKFINLTGASSLGVSIALPIFGYLIAYWGWASVFYVSGGLLAVWLLFWFYFVYDSPEEHPWISEEEREELKKKLKMIEFSQAKISLPWKQILTSGPVWAVIVGNTCCSATLFITITQLPTYLARVLHFDIKMNGWLSGLPHFVRYVLATLFAIAADKLINTGKFSTTTVRKTFGVICFFGMGCLFTIQALWGYSRITSIFVFTGSFGFMGLVIPAIYAVPVDIAPAYSSTIFGISQIPGCIGGYLVTKFVGIVTKENQEFQQWSYVFWFMAGINFFTVVFISVFLSAEEQSWSRKPCREETEECTVFESK